MSGIELCEAAGEGDLRTVRKLIHKKSVAVDSTDESNWTALHVAAFNGQVEIINFLMANGADVNVQDNSGATPWHLAVLSGSSEACEALLAHPDIDITKKDNQGKRGLQYAKERGVDDVVKLVKKEQSLAMKIRKGAARLSQRLTGSRRK